MSLQDWLQSKWLTEHTTDSGEIAGLLAAVDRDLKECTSTSLSPEWRLSIAYAAALRSATIALAVSGYRATRDQFHYRTIQSLRFTLQIAPEIIAELDLFRKKRNVTLYDQVQAISEHEADRMVELALQIREATISWLKQTHSDLM